MFLGSVRAPKALGDAHIRKSTCPPAQSEEFYRFVIAVVVGDGADPRGEGPLSCAILSTVPVDPPQAPPRQPGTDAPIFTTVQHAANCAAVFGAVAMRNCQYWSRKQVRRYSQRKVSSSNGTKLSAAAWPSVELQNSLFAFHRFTYRPSTVSMDMVILTLLFCAQTHGLLYVVGKLNAQLFIAAACISSHFWCHWASVPWAPAPRKQPDPTWRPNYFL